MSRFTEIGSALSVETRVRILELLRRRRLCVNALTCRLGMTQSAVSQHLSILKAAGLVQAEKIGYWVHYSFNPRTLTRYKKTLNKIFHLTKNG
jgi:DNA-binding transcriptional ArsR family regulator